jgi:DNA-binding transcriptional regulator LsrR (DeoR family)
MVGVPLEVLYQTSGVVGVAEGKTKVQAILGALRTGIVKILITDEPCARAVLELAEKTG